MKKKKKKYKYIRADRSSNCWFRFISESTTTSKVKTVSGRLERNENPANEPRHRWKHLKSRCSADHWTFGPCSRYMVQFCVCIYLYVSAWIRFDSIHKIIWMPALRADRRTISIQSATKTNSHTHLHEIRNGTAAQAQSLIVKVRVCARSRLYLLCLNACAESIRPNEIYIYLYIWFLLRFSPFIYDTSASAS